MEFGKNTDDNNETWTIVNGQAHGEYNHTLTENEMPSHRHRGLSWWGNDAKESITLNGGSGSGYNLSYSGGNINDQHTGIETRAAGSNWKHNNMPPYLGVYMWKRTA